MPFAVQADEYFLYQILSLMRAEPCANQTWRKRPTQGCRNFFEHALICDGFARRPARMTSAQRLLALFNGHLFGCHCSNLTK